MDFLNRAGFYIRDIFTDRLPFFPSNISISIFIILFCLIAIVELYIYITLSRIQQSIRRKQEVYWTNQISNIMTNIVLYDENDDTEKFTDNIYQDLKKLPLKNKIVNKLLTKEFIVYHKNFIGSIQDIIEQLYCKLGLDVYSKKRINDKNWEIKIEGIREAREMKLYALVDEIEQYTDDEESLLRMEAQASFVLLSKDNPFKFFDIAREKILDWHQIVLFEIITKNKEIQIPSFSKWLKSDNYTVVVMCLNLIEHFMQFDSANELEKLMKHNSPSVIKKAIKVAGTLELESVEKSIFEIFFDQSQEIKIEILRALGKIASGNYLDFLTSRMYSNDHSIKKEALYAIKAHPNKGKDDLLTIYNRSTEENKKIIAHVLDERILA